MKKTRRLPQKLAITSLTLLLGMPSLALWAQEEQPEPPQPESTEQTEVNDSEKTPESVSEETDAGNSPFDYQSSEEISEDLSVSFPVDI